MCQWGDLGTNETSICGGLAELFRLFLLGHVMVIEAV